MKNQTTDDIFKIYAEQANEKIENKREILEKYGLNCDMLKFKISDDNYENIKNFFKFNILINKKIIDDFDSSEVVLNALKKRYSKCNYNVEYVDKRYFKIDGKYLFETDTAQSFKTIFNQFLRDYYNDEFKEYLKYNNNKYSEYDRNVYLLNKLEKNEFEFKENHIELVELFNKLAGLYHSINNVVLVPYGYNIIRSNKFNDIYCLSISNLIDLGFDKDLIKTLGCIKTFEFDSKFYNEIKQKTRTNKNRIKLTEEQYKKYLIEAIDFICG